MSDPHGATPLPVDWANALRAVVEPLCAAQGTKKMGESLYKELLRCVQNLRDGELRTHEAAVQSVRSKMQYKLAEATKKLTIGRRAGTVKDEEVVTKVENFREQLTKKDEEIREMVADYEARLEEYAELESSLRWQITKLDGGIASADFERQQHIRHLQGQAVRRMKNAALAKGLDAWMEQFDEQRRMKAAATRMLNMGLSRCMSSWIETAYERAAQKRMLAAAASRLMRPALMASLAHWRNDWQAEVRGEAHLELLGRIAALEEALSQSRNETWTAVHAAKSEAAQHRVEAMGKAALRRMIGQQLAQGWEVWVEVWEEAVRKRRMMTAFVSRLLNQQLARGWEAWLDHWHSQQRDARMLSGFVGRLLNQRLASGWNTWAEVYEERQRKRGVMESFLRRLMSQQLSRGFETWLEQCEDQARQRRAMGAFVRRLFNQQLSRGWGAWLEQWEEQAAQKRILAGAVSRMRNPLLAGTFRFWRADWTSARLESVAQIHSEASIQVERMETELHEAQSVARAAEEVAAISAATIARQEREIEVFRKNLRTQLEESERQLHEGKQRADEAAAQYERKLRQSDVPTAVDEKRRLLAALNAKMKEMANPNGAGPIRMSHLVSLRDPILAAVSPRTRPLRQALLQLAITPSDPEGDAWAHHVTIADELERVQRVHRKALDALVPSLSSPTLLPEKSFFPSSRPASASQQAPRGSSQIRRTQALRQAVGERAGIA